MAQTTKPTAKKDPKKAEPKGKKPDAKPDPKAAAKAKPDPKPEAKAKKAGPKAKKPEPKRADAAKAEGREADGDPRRKGKKKAPLTDAQRAKLPFPDDVHDEEELEGPDSTDDDDDDLDDPPKGGKQLVDQGRDKGFLTYDEVNETLPDVVSPDQIDDVMSMFGEHDIPVVDAAKVGAAAEPKPTIATPDPEPEEKEEEEEEQKEEDSGVVKSNDPVRMYLRKMGSVSLLTREGEVEIAKRIEEGEKEVLRAVLHAPVAIAEIVELGDKLQKGKIRVRDVVKDAPETPQTEEAEAEVEVPEGEATVGEDGQPLPPRKSGAETAKTEQVIRTIDKIKRLDRECARLDEQHEKRKVAEPKKKELKQEK